MLYKKKGEHRGIINKRSNTQFIQRQKQDEMLYEAVEFIYYMPPTISHRKDNSVASTGCLTQIIWSSNEVLIGIQTGKRGNGDHYINTGGSQYVLYYTVEGYEENFNMRPNHQSRQE